MKKSFIFLCTCPRGGFQQADESTLKQRRIIKAIRKEERPSSSGVFAGINLGTGSKNFILSKNSTVDTGASKLVEDSATVTESTSPQTTMKALQESFLSLNKSFFQWMVACLIDNPDADWSPGLADYISHAKRLKEGPLGVNYQASASIASNASAPLANANKSTLSTTAPNPKAGESKPINASDVKQNIHKPTNLNFGSATGDNFFLKKSNH